jgi:HlyD family secretion protein
MKKGILWTIALAVFAGGVFIWMSKRPEFFKTSSFGAPAGTKIPGQPTTAVVGHRDINFSITAAGEIGPIDTVSVRPEVGGLIAKLSLDIGDKIKKGAILFTLNDYDLQTEKSSRKTEIEGAKLAVRTQTIHLEKTRLAFDRTQELFRQKLVPQETFDNARIDFELAGNALDIAKNRLETSQTALQTVEDKLTKTIIRAPFDCTILTRPVSIGQAVSGSSGFNSGTEVFTIANLEDMIITAHLNQADVTRLKVGQDVAIQIEAVPGLKLTGKVDRLAPQATFKNGVKGFATRILLKNAEYVVRPGMTANLSIPLISAGNVLAVPLGAVFSNQGERFAWVKKADGGFERRPVTLGVADYDYVEVTKGLNEGDEVSLVTPKEPAGSPVSGSTPTKDRRDPARSAK